MAHIFYAFTNILTNDEKQKACELMMPYLPPFRSQKVMSIKNGDDKFNSIFSFLLVFYSMGTISNSKNISNSGENLSYDNNSLHTLSKHSTFEKKPLPDFLHESSGRPFLNNSPDFSISHCMGAIACGITDKINDNRIGVDILDERKISSAFKNKLDMNHHSDNEVLSRFNQLEAITKLTGEGIHSILDNKKRDSLLSQDYLLQNHISVYYDKINNSSHTFYLAAACSDVDNECSEQNLYSTQPFSNYCHHISVDDIIYHTLRTHSPHCR